MESAKDRGWVPLGWMSDFAWLLREGEGKGGGQVEGDEEGEDGRNMGRGLDVLREAIGGF